MHRRRSGSILILALALETAAAAQPRRLNIASDRFDLDPSHSFIGFTVGFMGMTTVEGRFRRYQGTILFDDKDPAQSSMSLALKTDSIDTANDGRDKHLASADFFDAAKYPWITFQSTRIRPEGTGYVVTGTLVMHGITREIDVAVTRVAPRSRDMWENTRVGFDGAVTLKREDYGIVGPAFWNKAVTSDVEIRFKLLGQILNYDRITINPESIAAALAEALAAGGIDAASARNRELRASRPRADSDFPPVNRLGYKLMYEGKLREAIAVLEMNLAAFPEVADAHDSLAEAYARSGEKERALTHYRRSLELDAHNPSAREMVRSAARW